MEKCISFDSDRVAKQRGSATRHLGFMCPPERRHKQHCPGTRSGQLVAPPLPITVRRFSLAPLKNANAAMRDRLPASEAQLITPIQMTHQISVRNRGLILIVREDLTIYGQTPTELPKASAIDPCGRNRIGIRGVQHCS